MPRIASSQSPQWVVLCVLGAALTLAPGGGPREAPAVATLASPPRLVVVAGRLEGDFVVPLDRNDRARWLVERQVDPTHDTIGLTLDRIVSGLIRIVTAPRT